ncbi:FecR family protein [Pseudobacter ginsenosidimutans]|uniref:FecR family protein n=1 Tax=Pseudobacter ginsenosidimutans TaxID=661488 RepID=A0A4Q7N195_9BACT|nr:FecR family protein [Pseudobacter ginsenosidimutans]QEC43558.1 FecR family protein [Pseudobacter ginsenosidimutans]RZS74952.1 FecR family protein [Pseudobacter ginsenosidimutans]
MNIQEARTFVARFVQGNYTREEHLAFHEWVNGASMDHIEAIADEFAFLQKQVVLTGRPSMEWANSLESRIDSLKPASVVPMGRRRKLNAAIGWAAAVVVVLGAGLYFMLNKSGAEKAATEELATTGTKILPGSDKAVLTLADGRKVQLSSSSDGILAEEGGSVIRKINNSTLVYEQQVNATQQAEEYNTISTPRGGQYQVVLPDQTKIWLNAGSSIRFPVAFTGKERRVAITGEVYFEVAKNPNKPFKAVIATELTPDGVTKGRGEVEVVGTHFNIMAYKNEPVIQTTLLKGSVKVVSDKVSKVLKPGQQATIIDYPVATDQLTVQDISNAENLVAWKDGFFPGGSADVMMRQIARWYDVDLAYEGKVPEMKFEGQIPRTAGIESVLKILDANGIHTELDKTKRKIVVKQ